MSNRISDKPALPGFSHWEPNTTSPLLAPTVAVTSDGSRWVTDNNGGFVPAGKEPAMPQSTAQPTVPPADREHHAAMLKRMLAEIRNELGAASDIINSLARRTATLTGQVGDAGEFAVNTEQTSHTKTALDEATRLADTMDQHLGGMSTGVVTAEETMTVAVAALVPVDEAEDELRQAGAGTRAVAPARDGA